jgi:tetratricopeptide (TPR) repeat protein
VILAVATLSPRVPGQGADEGIRLFEAGEYAAAAALLGEVYSSDPDNREAASYYGLALVETGQFEQAAEPLRAAVGGPVPEDRLHVALARVHLGLRDAVAALRSLESARTAAPENPDVDFYTGIARLALRDYDAAVASFERVLERSPGRAMAHYYAGLAYNNLNDHSRMIDSFETFLALSPEGPEADRIRLFLRGVR